MFSTHLVVCVFLPHPTQSHPNPTSNPPYSVLPTGTPNSTLVNWQCTYCHAANPFQTYHHTQHRPALMPCPISALLGGTINTYCTGKFFVYPRFPVFFPMQLKRRQEGPNKCLSRHSLSPLSGAEIKPYFALLVASLQFVPLPTASTNSTLSLPASIVYSIVSATSRGECKGLPKVLQGIERCL